MLYITVYYHISSFLQPTNWIPRRHVITSSEAKEKRAFWRDIRKIQYLIASFAIRKVSKQSNSSVVSQGSCMFLQFTFVGLNGTTIPRTSTTRYIYIYIYMTGDNISYHCDSLRTHRLVLSTQLMWRWARKTPTIWSCDSHRLHFLDLHESPVKLRLAEEFAFIFKVLLTVRHIIK